MLKCGGGGRYVLEWKKYVSKHGIYKIHVYKIHKCVTKISLFVSKVQLQPQEKKMQSLKLATSKLLSKCKQFTGS